MALVHGSPEYYQALREIGIYTAEEESMWFRTDIEAAKQAAAKKKPDVTGGGFFSFDWLSPAVKNLGTAYSKYLQMDMQKDMWELKKKYADMQIRQGGIPGMPTYGGLNLYTIVALAGVGFLAFVLLKKV